MNLSNGYDTVRTGSSNLKLNHFIITWIKNKIFLFPQDHKNRRKIHKNKIYIRT